MLFSIAYRMLGSVMDAEDLVQEAYLRWDEAKETDVRSPRAYLTTIVTRLAINQLRAARTKRETYVGPWLPEPLVTEVTPDAVELAESLSMAFLLLLERLGPVERAAYLLHEVFDFEYAEIARVLDKTEANCRQLVARARKRIGSPHARFEADPAHARRLVEKFTEASFAGDMEGLIALPCTPQGPHELSPASPLTINKYRLICYRCSARSWPQTRFSRRWRTPAGGRSSSRSRVAKRR
jgi:RNA polymerase sigma-70 factor (ECF subfamily)